MRACMHCLDRTERAEARSINILTDSIERDKGEVLYNDYEIAVSLGAKYRELLGYMPQQQRLYDNYTAEEFLKYMAAVRGDRTCPGEGRRLRSF